MLTFDNEPVENPIEMTDEVLKEQAQNVFPDDELTCDLDITKKPHLVESNGEIISLDSEEEDEED